MKKKFFVTLFVLILQNFLWCQDGEFSWDFSDCDIKDILYAVSLDTGISIVADDTVSGKSSFRYSGKNFEQAFDSFLNASRLYVLREENLWIVSRISIVREDGLYKIDACDVSPNLLLEKLSIAIDAVVTYEALPSLMLTIHHKGLSQDELLESIVLRLSGFELKKNGNNYHIARAEVKQKELSSAEIVIQKRHNGQIFVDAKNAKVGDVIEKLFIEIEDRQYCFLVAADGKISRCCFTGKSFEETLDKLCEQNGLSNILSDGVYYIISDSGSKDRLVSESKNWEKFTLEYLRVETLLSVVNKRFGKIESISLGDNYSFLCYVTQKQKAELEALIKELDIKTETYLIELNYIKPEEFLRYVPPEIDKSHLYAADSNSGIYFTGTEAAYNYLLQQISICDRPAVRISYDLLILQYDENNDNNWSANFKINRLGMGDRTDGFVALGSVLNLNLNIVTNFGLEFAEKLQAAMEENSTKVFADTTLHGVSGKQIHFQNTNTYRYRDNNLDPDTGKPVYSGVTREILSGLKLDITGWVSGNGMITSSVTASITRQGTDTSSSTGNPPPTTEKIVTTEVCGKSGEPIVLSGLMQDSETEFESGFPYISKIPLIGNLFKSKNKSYQQSQITIYLIPHIEGYESIFIQPEADEREWAANRCKNFCRKFLMEETNEQI